MWGFIAIGFGLGLLVAALVVSLVMWWVAKGDWGTDG